MSIVRDRIELKFWQDSGDLTLIGTLADTFYDRVQERLDKLNRQIDADAAPIKMVELLGWERDIERFEGESDALFRKRVKYALLNAKDAGEKDGFEKIWSRLGLGEISQTERFDAENWDVIKLVVDETVFGEYMELLNVLIRQYGRTCRRYEFESWTANTVGVRTCHFDAEYFHTQTSLNHSLSAQAGARTFTFYADTFNAKVVL
eukprot:TRINITY_DN7068_c0_g1_i1.p1 TRINITY_DN7068_c0_g1~~TRINITY_DN7068_c0_g1_i1.p1  ORF type:complete len:205 (+),score=28.82 TRINITY_DN7068_c0_g1_i1:550-1164(+)